ncbi:hypothetical protein SAMN05421753_102131 [Planctomicrobium piriforme]|uniref:Uncharacterized protein n=1 Tax=Planctomicrobium piriforme TaxID=1576369 RepID=A0A1I3C752_9PLAN|nr:hypothetical protein SAMN05421753_102131 [Planctomicrobium piriforme]
MISRTTQQSRSKLADLPQQVREQARTAYRIFLSNPHHPGHRFKKVQSAPDVYSVRIGIGYRALGAPSGETIVWFGSVRTPTMIAS